MCENESGVEISLELAKHFAKSRLIVSLNLAGHFAETGRIMSKVVLLSYLVTYGELLEFTRRNLPESLNW